MYILSSLLIYGNQQYDYEYSSLNFKFPHVVYLPSYSQYFTWSKFGSLDLNIFL